MNDTAKNLIERDKRCIWHPYTQHSTEADPLTIASAKGSVLTLVDGTELIDGISSWWATLHGHGHPKIAEAFASQSRTLDHVLFAGATHEPAVRLAERLLAKAPKGLTRVFYSDNGSTAVEVALKMALQMWCHRNEPKRQVFICLNGAYHGDTFGAMAVGDPDPFFLPFTPMLFRTERVAPSIEAIESALKQLSKHCAGVILEPLIQGAAGMLMQTTAFLQEVRSLCDRYGVPMIADEVMTGFGRTGSLFACEKAGITPDLLCLAKGLTGGSFPLSATLTTDLFFDAFLSEDRIRAFFHGHTFTGNPIGCAVGLASLDIVEEEDTPARLEAIGVNIEEHLRGRLEGQAHVQNLRRTGGVVAFDLVPSGSGAAGYLSALQPMLRAAAVERGVLLRPLGNVLYALPPSSTSPEQCEQIANAMLELAELCR
jgi:adenosylmethionine-8-amino-7-oxononanoate aminotransferase